MQFKDLKPGQFFHVLNDEIHEVCGNVVHYRGSIYIKISGILYEGENALVVRLDERMRNTEGHYWCQHENLWEEIEVVPVEAVFREEPSP